MGRVAARFARVEPRRRARAFVAGLLARLPRTNCWTIAEHAGNPNPYGMQHLLGRAVWDAEAVRDDVRGYLVEHLAAADGVLAVDETGDLKKGSATVGVQRQYTGTAGRIENAQVTVWLTYATAAGTGRSTCPGAGPRTHTGAPRPESPPRSGSPLSPRWPGR
jgi:SRSO17 transposase